MTDFGPVIEAQLAGKVLGGCYVVSFDFKSGPCFYWPGFGPRLVDGKIYVGTRGLGTLSSVEGGGSGGAAQVTFSIAGPPAMLATIREDQEEAEGRAALVGFSFSEVRGRDETDNPVLGQPLATLRLFTGIMGALTVERPVTRPGETPSRIVSVTAVDRFRFRRRSALGLYTDVDQNMRVAAAGGSRDNIFSQVPSFVNASRDWPHFGA